MKKSTLFAVLVALALGGAVWYFEFKREKPAEDSSSAFRPIFNFKPDDVAGITLTRGGETTVIERRGKEWRITKPIDAAADSNAVDSLLNSLAYGSVSRTIAVAPPGSVEKLKEFGLDSPGVTLEIKRKSGALHRLRLGAKDFSGGSVYALVDAGTDVAILSSDVLTSSDKPRLDLRDRRIAVFDREKIVRFRVKNRHGTLVAEKKTEKDQEEKWLILEPAKFKGQRVETTRILNPIENARATDILDSPTPADRARLAKPAIEVELTDQDNQKTEVALASGKEQVLARASLGPMLFKVAQSIFDTLNFKPQEVIKKAEPKEEEATKESPKQEEPKKPNFRKPAPIKKSKAPEAPAKKKD